jgi:hypothetical protein
MGDGGGSIGESRDYTTDSGRRQRRRRRRRCHLRLESCPNAGRVSEIEYARAFSVWRMRETAPRPLRATGTTISLAPLVRQARARPAKFPLCGNFLCSPPRHCIRSDSRGMFRVFMIGTRHVRRGIRERDVGRRVIKVSYVAVAAQTRREDRNLRLSGNDETRWGIHRPRDKSSPIHAPLRVRRNRCNRTCRRHVRNISEFITLRIVVSTSC